MCPTVLLPFLLVLIKFAWIKTEPENKFTEIQCKPTFVDKTPLIHEFLQHKYLFINAPSKFGKSTNLDMLSLFLSNHRYISEIENYFVQTKIWENKEFVKTNLGQHPVINFSLKVRGYSSDFEQTLTAFKVSMYNAFIDHMYLLESESLTAGKRKLLELYTDLTRVRLMDNDVIANGLSFLTEVLYEHHKKPVILLADEFGRGISEGILNNHGDLKTVLEMYSSILNNTFNNASIISHALLTGESWLYSLHDPAVTQLVRVAFLQKLEFSRYYGFTYDEVEQLFNKFNIPQDGRAEVLKWYGGYTTLDGLFKLCNPYSILQYLQHKTHIVYWTGSALASDLIRNMVEDDSLKKLIIELVMKKTVEMELGNSNIENVKFFTKMIVNMPSYGEKFYLQILLEAGYLTYAENQAQQDSVLLKFPNEEVLSAVVKFTV